MKLFILLSLVAAVAADFGDFKKRHNRKYRDFEHAAQAEAHYNRHKKLFDEHNAKFAAGEVTFTVGENDFADRNITEVIARICGTTPPKDMRALPAIKATTLFPPGAASIDWSYLMQPIANQGNHCGSCWAFATVAQLESLYKRNSPPYSYVMSPQYLIDCDPINVDGCSEGGWPAFAMGKMF